MKVVEDTLINSSDGNFDTADALLSAATNELTSLDGVYFLLRRDPDVLQKLLSEAVVDDGVHGENLDGNMNSGSGAVSTGTTVTTKKAGKRKRG